ncbi:unnamed protein product [Amoebophrya sp. A120]|nr:unnamed protein product [Amoebophrya sp. A120]|eukprot:GSA120T00007840001.1
MRARRNSQFSEDSEDLHVGPGHVNRELRDVTSQSFPAPRIGKTSNNRFEFDSEEELHFDLADVDADEQRRRKNREDASFVQWCFIFSCCLVFAGFVFFLLSLRANSLNSQKFTSPRPPHRRDELLPARERAAAAQKKISPKRTVGEDHGADSTTAAGAATHTSHRSRAASPKKPNPNAKGIPLSDKLKEESLERERLAKKEQHQTEEGAHPPTQHHSHGPDQPHPMSPAHTVNLMMEKRYEKLVNAIADRQRELAKQPNPPDENDPSFHLIPVLKHQPRLRDGNLDHRNAPQPALTSPRQRVDFGWRFENPYPDLRNVAPEAFMEQVKSSVKGRFASAEDHVLDLCRGRKARLPDGEEYVMYTLNTAQMWRQACFNAFYTVFTKEYQEQQQNPQQKVLRFGDFQSLHFFFPDGNYAPQPHEGYHVPQGFPVPRQSSIRANSVDQNEILRGINDMLDDAGDENLVFLTMHVNRNLKEYPGYEVQTIAFYAMVGRRDIRPVEEQSRWWGASSDEEDEEESAADQQHAAQHKKHHHYKPKVGGGVWKVQVAKDERGHDVCPGSMVQLFDTLNEMRFSIWPDFDITLILDASWSYATGDTQNAEFTNENKQAWLKSSEKMRRFMLKLMDPNLSDNQKLQIRAQILEGVKTPGRNCYLAPLLANRYTDLTRMSAVTDNSVAIWDKHTYPNMNVPGLFPGINYYIFYMPEIKAGERGERFEYEGGFGVHGSQGQQHQNFVGPPHPGGHDIQQQLPYEDLDEDSRYFHVDQEGQQQFYHDQQLRGTNSRVQNHASQEDENWHHYDNHQRLQQEHHSPGHHHQNHYHADGNRNHDGSRTDQHLQSHAGNHDRQHHHPYSPEEAEEFGVPEHNGHEEFYHDNGQFYDEHDYDEQEEARREEEENQASRRQHLQNRPAHVDHTQRANYKRRNGGDLG